MNQVKGAEKYNYEKLGKEFGLEVLPASAAREQMGEVMRNALTKTVIVAQHGRPALVMQSYLHYNEMQREIAALKEQINSFKNIRQPNKQGMTMEDVIAFLSNKK